MIFVAFISASIVRRGIPTYEGGAGAYSTEWELLPLPIPFLGLDSCILILGCLSLQRARRRSAEASSQQLVPQSPSPWLYSAIALGLAFLAGQAMIWRLLQAHGLVMRTSARVAFFYLLTGTHAIQIVVGVLVLIWIVARQTNWTTMGRYVAIDLATRYFSAMAVLWIVLVCFLVFA
jgi:cytochrome c oxidase subunit 3